ncbi:DUF3533 domain-containing protein [Blastococcus sp. TF02-09]|uniref:DUF3533 domain-containing protein n=1 Tax=Blastococcus sp. TF02-09 TaxID=2250576 RepID=UPI0018F6DB95|nr:DUF3533 domain-containing protein [Blastococcus sp. TF02-9]
MPASSVPGRHEAPAEPSRPATETFTEELRDAFAPRTLLLVVGVALLCLGFVLSYVGAFHDPTPHRIPVAVVAPAQVSGQLVAALDDADGEPVAATAVADEAAARRLLERGEVAGALVVDVAGTQDTLLVASGGGVSMTTAVQRIFTEAEATRQRSLVVDDVVPHQPGDPQGTSGFYVVVGAVLAGYLLAAVLGMAKGARPATFRRALWRLGATVPYSLAVGLGIALVTGPLLGAITGHVGAVFVIATLLVLSAATVTMSFQVLFGVFGIAATILVFVVVGNPSAGGAYRYELLPPFWRAVGPWLPNGAGVDALRSAVYFGGTGTAAALWIVVAWAVAGAALTVLAARIVHRRAA